MSTLTNKTVLVVEDERSLQHAIQAKLEKAGYKVLTARSVEEATNHFDGDTTIDVIWLDHYLFGKEDGLDFVAKIKNDNTHRTIPIFVVSNTASLDKVQSYLRLGVAKYYTKADYRLEEIIDDIGSSLDSNESGV